MPIHLRKIIRVALTCTLACLVFLLLSTLAFSTSQPYIKDRIQQSFQDKSLSTENYFANDYRRGKYLFNDCVILQTLVNWGGLDSIAGTLSSTIVLSETPPCEVLDRALLDPQSPTQKYVYSRYYWGAKALVGPALAIASIDTIKGILSGSVYVALIAAALVAAYKLWRGLYANPELGATVLVFTAGMLTLYDLRGYTSTFAHGFSELVLASYLLYAATRPNGVKPETVDLGLIIFGTATAWFELLTGPMLIAIAMACLIEYSAANPLKRTRWNAIKAACLVASPIAVSFLFLQICVALILGPGNVEQFLYHVLLRMQLHQILPIPIEEAWQIPINTQTYSIKQISDNLISVLPGLTHGNALIAKALFGGCLLIFIGAAISITVKPGDNGATLVYLSVAALVPAWYLVFSNHTAVHAFFMVRLMVLWPICAALSLAHFWRTSRSGSGCPARPHRTDSPGQP